MVYGWTVKGLSVLRKEFFSRVSFDEKGFGILQNLLAKRKCEKKLGQSMKEFEEEL